MGNSTIKTGCLPYGDGSGFEIEITIEAPIDHFKYDRIKLNPDSEFTDFDIEKWPEVRDGIDRAINAWRHLHKKEGE